KNPYMYNAFMAPSPTFIASQDNTNLGTEVNFSLADLWQLPRRKKVAQGDLTIRQLEVTVSVIEQVLQVQLMYDTCLAFEEKIKSAYTSLGIVETWLQNAERSKKPTFGERLTGYTLQGDIFTWQATILSHKQQLSSTYLALRNALNIMPNTQPIACTSSLSYDALPQLDCALLEQAALERSYDV